MIHLTLSIHEARALAHSAELTRHLFENTIAKGSALADAHLRLLSALEREEAYEAALGESRH